MASPYSKAQIQSIAYYFDDERIAIVKKSGSGEWDSIQDDITPDPNDYLQVYYHARYNTITGLENDINSDVGLSPGLQTALVYYVKYRIAEDDGDLRMAGYFYNRFLKKIKQYPYRMAGKRGIQMYGI